MKEKTRFPLIDSLLFLPKAGEEGRIGICTNTTSSGQVFNEIDEKYRKSVSVLGSLIVSRDGAERMILNSLAHPTLKYLILFSEESLTFSPSTNLLLALERGLDEKKEGNYIKNHVAASGQYPNLSKKILDEFRKNIIVLPIFMHKSGYSKTIIESYLKWLDKEKKVPRDTIELLRKINESSKIYYDSLNKLIENVGKIPAGKKSAIKLDAKDFQHLQPPLRELKEENVFISAPFKISKENGSIRVDLEVGGTSCFIKGKGEFMLEYSLMKFLGEKKNLLSPLEQLALGAEIGRVGTEILNGVSFSPFVKQKNIKGKKEIFLEASAELVMDQKYYYKIGVKDKKISVMCMAFDMCEEVFELRAKKTGVILSKLAELGRFEEYGMDILHRMDVGTQIGRAGIAADLGYVFIQDFANIFKINTKNLPFVAIEGNNFLDIHKSVLQSIYSQGITDEHGDVWKGTARTAVVLAVYRDAQKALSSMPKVYEQGSETTSQMRSDYKKQLLRFDHDGSYSYGERTRTFFGFDQLLETPKILRKNPKKAAIIQRYDPSEDMSSYTDEATGKIKFSHDPCLTHDIFFIRGGKLHSFHTARAHNAVNAYPENIFGLHDAYFETIRKKLGLKSGDTFMLSNRANILLLTEEQRTKKLLSEPSKPMADNKTDRSAGPYQMGKNIKPPKKKMPVAYLSQPLKKAGLRPKNEFLDKIENYNGVNTLERAIDYLKDKGVMHNNTVLSTYRAGTSHPQEECLVFMQANVFGGKLHLSAVFANRSPKKKVVDVKFCEYIATKHSKKLKVPLGDLTLFYVG